MTDRLEHLTELALIMAIPDMCVGKLKHSRTKSIYKRIQKYTVKEFQKFGIVSNSDKNIMLNRIIAFSKKVDWERREVDITVLFSFVLGLIEDSRHKYSKRLIRELNDAVSWVTHDKIEAEYIEQAVHAIKVWRCES